MGNPKGCPQGPQPRRRRQGGRKNRIEEAHESTPLDKTQTRFCDDGHSVVSVLGSYSAEKVPIYDSFLGEEIEITEISANPHEVRVSETRTGKLLGRAKRIDAGIHGLAASQDGALLGVVHDEGVQVWNRDLQDVFYLEGKYYHGGKLQSDLVLTQNGHTSGFPFEIPLVYARGIWKKYRSVRCPKLSYRNSFLTLVSANCG